MPDEQQPANKPDSAPAERTPGSPPTVWTAPETLMTLVAAFAIALLFRGFVIEPFMIPTGSMAPTLLGEHARLRDERAGISWNIDARAVTGRNGPAELRSPVTGERFATPDTTNAGDRVLVQKYSYAFVQPKRYDVVVLHNPLSPDENFIKRLVGLPGEQIALVDGDVFVRAPEDRLEAANNTNPWLASNWHPARKPERVQRAVWRTIYDSSLAPPQPASSAAEPFRSPWVGDADRVSGTDRAVISVSPGDRTELRWDDAWWPITDIEAYNQTRGPSPASSVGPLPVPIGATVYPVGDVRLRAGVRTSASWDEALELAMVVRARGHEFKAQIASGRARLTMRPEGEATTVNIDAGAVPPARFGQSTSRVRDVEFWHCDQTLWLFIDGTLVAGGPANNADTGGTYDWDIQTRLNNAMPSGDLMSALDIQPNLRQSVFSEPSIYAPVEAWMEVGSPAPVELHRVALDRDLHYSPFHNPGAPHGHLDLPLGTHPDRTPMLRDDQVMVLGDNSPASSDSRYWPDAHPRVQRAFPESSQAGLVPIDMLVGRAFAVYFPAIEHDGILPIPDFGRIRWIE